MNCAITKTKHLFRKRCLVLVYLKIDTLQFQIEKLKSITLKCT